MWIALPLSSGQLEALGSSALGDVVGHAATPALASAQGFEPNSEEAERAASIYASVAALCLHGRRLVAVVEAPGDIADPEDPFGRVRVASVSPGHVRSVFADLGEADARARELAPIVSGVTLEDAWERDDVHAFLADAELMWFDPTEISLLVAGD